MSESAKLESLRAENARLIALLETHGIAWQKPTAPAPAPSPKEPESVNLTPDEKVALFMRLFHGRTDVYPIRWESKKTGKSGYSPACVNEWRAGVCDKPRIKCADCSNRVLRPLTEVVAPFRRKASTAVTSISGRAWAMESAIAPLPVPRSSRRNKPTLPRIENCLSRLPPPPQAGDG